MPPTQPPTRLVTADHRSWTLQAGSGVYMAAWSDETRTREELAGAVPVVSAPDAEVEHIRDQLVALTPARHRATAQGALWHASHLLWNREDLGRGSGDRLWAGRPGSNEQEYLRWLVFGDRLSRARIDIAQVEEIARTLVEWVTGDTVAHIDSLYEALVGPVGDEPRWGWRR